MALVTVSQTPDGETNFESGGPTGDAYALNFGTTEAVVFEFGMQNDELFVGKTYVKSGTGSKSLSFLRFRVDVFPFNVWPTAIQFKLTASQDQADPFTSTDSVNMRIGWLDDTYRAAWATPDGSDEGGWHSDNYADHEDYPHISGVRASGDNGDTLVSAALMNGYTPKTHVIPRGSIDEDDQIVFGSPGSPGNDYSDNFLVWQVILSELISLGKKVFAVALDPVGMANDIGAAEYGIYWVSDNAPSGTVPEFLVTYEDHLPTIDNGDEDATLLHGIAHSIQFAGSTTDGNSAEAIPAWTLTSNPGGASIDAATGLFTWASPVGPGVYDFTVRYTRTSQDVAVLFQSAQDYGVNFDFTLTVTGPAAPPPDRELGLAALEDQVEGNAALEDQVAGLAELAEAISGKANLE
jgi:hypothetical protein